MIGIPVAAALLIYKRGKSGFRPIWIGAAVFVLSQVGHIPFNQFLMIPGLRALGVDVAAQGGISLLVLGVVAGLSAGVFEEVARFLALKFWLKKDAHTLLPVKYGIGHGGVEALLLGLLALFALVQVMVLGGEGAVDLLPPEQVELARTQLAAYWAVPWYHSLLGAAERISAMAFHVGASILVYKSVRTKNYLYLVVAVIGHMILDSFAVIAIKQMNILLLEGVIFVFSVGWLYWAWRIREIDPEEDLDLPVPPQVQISAAQVTGEQIEESRYD
ncbi:MAG: YhfC family intramembrane metalloprotease [Anaerolineales bacterium]|nr:YhfC family intramembrane metalloprotease [Anaerolineales bacterium]